MHIYDDVGCKGLFGDWLTVETDSSGHSGNCSLWVFNVSAAKKLLIWVKCAFPWSELLYGLNDTEVRTDSIKISSLEINLQRGAAVNSELAFWSWSSCVEQSVCVVRKTHFFCSGWHRVQEAGTELLCLLRLSCHDIRPSLWREHRHKDQRVLLLTHVHLFLSHLKLVLSSESS